MGLHPVARRGPLGGGVRPRLAWTARRGAVATADVHAPTPPSAPEADEVAEDVGDRPAQPGPGAFGDVALHRVLEQARELGRAPDVASTLHRLEEAARAVSGAVHARTWLLDPTGTALHAPASRTDGADGADCADDPLASPDAGPRDTVPVGSGVVGGCAAASRPVTVRTTGSLRELSGGAGPGDGDDPTVVTLHHLALPLVSAARLVGVLDVAWPPDDAPESAADERPAALEILATLGAAQIEAAGLRANGAATADRDPETGLPHAQRLARDVAQECARTVRYGHPFSLVAIRVDEIGPWRGADSALAVAADLVHAHVRAADAVYRLDAAAIVVLAPQTGPEGAAALADRLRAAVVRRFTPAPGDTAGPDSSPQVSVAWAGSPVDADTAEALLDDVRARLAGAPPRD